MSTPSAAHLIQKLLESEPPKDEEVKKPEAEEPEAKETPKKDEEADEETPKKEKEYQTHHPRKVEAAIKALWQESYAKKFGALASDFKAEAAKVLKKKLKLSDADVDKMLFDGDSSKPISSISLPVAILQDLI